MVIKRIKYYAVLFSVCVTTLYFSACSDSTAIKSNFKNVASSLGDTIRLSDSLSLYISEVENGFKIESIKRNEPGPCEFVLYKNGSLKSIQNIKGEIQKENKKDDWVTLYNLQSLELDTNGFINNYYLSRDFIEVAKGNY